MREADGEALALAVAENVIRADLNPVEEARAYQRLADEHGDPPLSPASSGRASGWSPTVSTCCAARGGAGAARRAHSAARLRAGPRPHRRARTSAGRPDRAWLAEAA